MCERERLETSGRGPTPREGGPLAGGSALSESEAIAPCLLASHSLERKDGQTDGRETTDSRDQGSYRPKAGRGRTGLSLTVGRTGERTLAQPSPGATAQPRQERWTLGSPSVPALLEPKWGDPRSSHSPWALGVGGGAYKLRTCRKRKGTQRFIILISPHHPHPTKTLNSLLSEKNTSRVFCPQSAWWPSSREVLGVRGLDGNSRAGTVGPRGLGAVLCCLPGPQGGFQAQTTKERCGGGSRLLVYESGRGHGDGSSGTLGGG